MKENLPEFELIRSSRKTVCVQITREAKVVVRAPHRMKKEAIEACVGKHTDWILKHIEKREEKNAEYLHFTMEDNPTLSDKVKRRYRETFHGTFFRRFVLGEWVAAEGLVYDFYDELPWPEVPEGSPSSE